MKAKITGRASIASEKCVLSVFVLCSLCEANSKKRSSPSGARFQSTWDLALWFPGLTKLHGSSRSSEKPSHAFSSTSNALQWGTWTKQQMMPQSMRVRFSCFLITRKLETIFCPLEILLLSSDAEISWLSCQNLSGVTWLNRRMKQLRKWSHPEQPRFTKWLRALVPWYNFLDPFIHMFCTHFWSKHPLHSETVHKPAVRTRISVFFLLSVQSLKLACRCTIGNTQKRSLALSAGIDLMPYTLLFTHWKKRQLKMEK